MSCGNQLIWFHPFGFPHIQTHLTPKGVPGKKKILLSGPYWPHTIHAWMKCWTGLRSTGTGAQEATETDPLYEVTASICCSKEMQKKKPKRHKTKWQRGKETKKYMTRHKKTTKRYETTTDAKQVKIQPEWLKKETKQVKIYVQAQGGQGVRGPRTRASVWRNC